MYLLFISYNSGLMHNSIFETIKAAHQSIEQLIQEEQILNAFVSLNDLILKLAENDDIKVEFANKTWFHLQMQPVFSIP